MKFLTYIAIIFFSFSILSCSDFLDVNENPNAVTDPPIDGLLSKVTYNTGLNSSNLAGQSGYWVQYFAGVNGSSPIDIYDYVNTSSTWNSIYLTLADNYELITRANESGATHHEAVGKIIEAYHIMSVSDYWNAGPYTEAFDGGTTQPKWESGAELYEIAKTNLTEAESLLGQEPSRSLDADSDLIYFGDISLWKKTIYALRARMALHEGQLASISGLIDASYQSNDDDMQMSSFQNRNPWAQTAVNNDGLILGGFLSAQYINTMNGTITGIFDPRLPLITNETKFGDYRGTVNGEGRVGDGISDEECYLEVTGFYSTDKAPLFIMTFSELKFIEAEALFSTNKALAYQAYLDGIKANMEKVGVEQVDMDAYLADPNVAVGAGSLTIDDIMLEKYKALFLSSETWNDARRHDFNYAGFSLPTGANLPDYIQIAPTPEIELANNRENAIENTLNTPVWWDN